MGDGGFNDNASIMRLTPAAYSAIPVGSPDMICERPIGHAWREIGLCGIRICVLLGIGHDGPIVERYRPVIRVQAFSRVVPRQLGVGA